MLTFASRFVMVSPVPLSEQIFPLQISPRNQISEYKTGAQSVITIETPDFEQDRYVLNVIRDNRQPVLYFPDAQRQPLTEQHSKNVMKDWLKPLNAWAKTSN